MTLQEIAIAYKQWAMLQSKEYMERCEWARKATIATRKEMEARGDFSMMGDVQPAPIDDSFEAFLTAQLTTK